MDKLGTYNLDASFNDLHIEKVLNLDLVNVELVKKSNFKVVVDAELNRGFMVPKLLEKMGVECVKLCCSEWRVSRNPEPLQKI